MERAPEKASVDVAGNACALNEEGFLADAGEWTPAFAEALARRNGLELSAAHWVVIDCVREYHAKFDIEPPMRVLVGTLKQRLGGDKGTSRFLYRLFPDSPVREACRYAGLPKPVSCI